MVKKIDYTTLDYTALILTSLNTHFLGDVEKSDHWLNTIHPLLGNISPIEMMALGHAKKVYEVLGNIIEGHHP